MTEFADPVCVRDARAMYHAANGFSEAAYREPWAKVKLGPIPVVFPNVSSRQRALPLHDLHHVATGYSTSFTGEAEIGAWEIAGGCTDHWAAWVLDAGAFAYGLFLAPRRVYAAFMRGRLSRTLYHDRWDDSLLDLTVAELRRRIGWTGAPPIVSWRDRAAFAAWVVLVSMPWLAAGALVVAWLR